MVEEKILNILRETNDELLTYDGDNMLRDGIVNSFTFIALVSSIEDEFDLEIDDSLLNSKYFGNKDRVIKTVMVLMEKN